MAEEKIEKLKIKLQKLVDDFKDADGWGKSEEDIQTSFTVELLKLLGWDSKSWKINTGQDVQTGKKPDIVLKTASSKLLVIESKDAHKKDMLDGAYQNKTFTEQLFSYCRGEGLYWGVLTNFVEWRLYNAHQKRLYKNIKYAFHDLLWEGADKNDYINLLSEEGLFFLSKISKENLSAKLGKIDSDPVYYPEQLDLAVEKVKKEFFSKIKNWRSQLKKYIEKNYPRYGADKIDLMAQQIIDRMIFIDICHDKGVVAENHIRSVLSSKLLEFDELKEKFRLMNEKFDTELFDRGECDEIKINDQVMVPIIRELDEIDFSKLSVNIIGEVYENYLGELLKSTSETTDEKRRKKRKEQGIYYTPAYIVDYIVQNTVGELLKKVKTEKEIEKIRVIDPACGSGSFLIRVFDEFLNAYRRILKVPEGQTTLDEFSYRRKILQDNIFGVDLDERAVEITKLNLMIKAIDKVKPRDMQGAHLLPNLSLNIRCGNSLIGGEKIEDFSLSEEYKKEIEKLVELKEKFYNEKEGSSRGKILEEIRKLENVIDRNVNRGLVNYFKNQDKFKPFNFQVAFCEIFRNGGFDVVVGNPPWVTVEKSAIGEGAWQYYKSNFKSVEIFKLNYFPMFVETSIDSLKKDAGLLGMILPNRLLDTPSYKLLRKKIIDNKLLKLIVDLPAGEFEDVVAGNIILVLCEKTRNKFLILRKIFENGQIKKDFDKEERRIKDINREDYVINLNLNERVSGLLKKVDRVSLPLREIFDVHVGMMIKNKEDQFIKTKMAGYSPIVVGRDFQRYALLSKSYFNYSKITIFGGTKKREKHEVYPKILVRKTGNTITAIIDNDGIYAEQSVYLLLPKVKQNLPLILGLLNSKLVNFYFRNKLITNPEAYPYIQHYDLEKLPIRKIQTLEEEKISNKFVELVGEMLALNKTAESREKNKTKIEAVDYEIDQLVYKLYGLGDEEIKIIEED